MAASLSELEGIAAGRAKADPAKAAKRREIDVCMLLMDTEAL